MLCYPTVFVVATVPGSATQPKERAATIRSTDYTHDTEDEPHSGRRCLLWAEATCSVSGWPTNIAASAFGQGSHHNRVA